MSKDKFKVVLAYAVYPMAIAKYFESALRARDDVELFTVGPYTGTWIPWNGGMYLPQKYCGAPDFPLDKNFITNVKVNPTIVEGMMPWDEADLWINADSNFCFSRPKKAKNVVTIAIDPHVLNYDYQRTQCDMFFNMQLTYSKPGDKYLPYAACEQHHYPEDLDKVYDVCLIGLHYPDRTNLVNRLRAKGLNVYYDIGPVFDEYRQLYSQSKVAISWSSQLDLIARVFEAMAMDVPLVCNRVPDMDNFFVDGDHYYGFNNIDEAEAQVLMALANYDDALEVSKQAHRKVMAQHLYKYRIADILKAVKLK